MECFIAEKACVWRGTSVNNKGGVEVEVSFYTHTMAAVTL